MSINIRLLAPILTTLPDPLRSELIRSNVCAHAVHSAHVGIDTPNYAHLFPDDVSTVRAAVNDAMQGMPQSVDSLLMECTAHPSPLQGAFGIVHEAVDRLGRRLALKTFKSGSGLTYADKLAEAHNVLQLQDRFGFHTGVVKIHHVIASARTPVIVMDFVPGTPLSLLTTNRRLSVSRVVSLVAAILDALDHAHALLVHRDLKPSNIIVRPDGVPTLIDFGLAVLHGANADSSGTPLYMAPELLANTGRTLVLDGRTGDPLSLPPIDLRSDLWSVGVILYELLTGTHPFPSESVNQLFSAIARDPVPPLTSRNPLLSKYPSVAAMCYRFLKKDPAERFESAAQAADALRKAQGADTPHSVTSTLLHHIDESDKYLRRHPRCVARDSESSVFTEFLKSRDRGVLVVTGAPGSGKSALLAEWHRRTRRVAHRSPVCYSFSRDMGIVQPDVFLQDLIVTLSTTYGLDTSSVSNIPNARLLRELNRILAAEISPSLPSSAQQLIFIDALDEASVGEDGRTAFECIPVELPRGIFFVVSSRHLDSWYERRWTSCCVFNLSSQERVSHNAAAVQAFVTDQDFPLCVDELVKAEIASVSKGNFLVASLLCRHVKARPDQRNIESLLEELSVTPTADSLATTLAAMWRTSCLHLTLQDRQVLRSILSLIVSAESGMTAKMLSDADSTITLERWNWAFERLAPFLVRSSRFPLCYEVFHDGLRAFFADPVLDVTSHANLGRACIRWYSEGNASTECAYGIREVLTHLSKGGQHDLLETVMLGDLDFWQQTAAGKRPAEVLIKIQLALSTFPIEKPAYRLLKALEGIWSGIGHYVSRFPEQTFQELWNACWWFDAPVDTGHYDGEASRYADVPSNACRLHIVAERWRSQWESRNHGAKWLRALRPHFVFGMDLASEWSVFIGGIADSLSYNAQRGVIGMLLGGRIVIYDRHTFAIKARATLPKAHSYARICVLERPLVVYTQDTECSLVFMHLDESYTHTVLLPDRARCIEFSASGQHVIVGTESGWVGVFDLNGCEAWSVQLGVSSNVECVSLAADGLCAAVNQGGAVIILSHGEDGQVCSRVITDERSVRSLISGSAEGVVVVSNSGIRFIRISDRSSVTVCTAEPSGILEQYPELVRIHCSHDAAEVLVHVPWAVNVWRRDGTKYSEQSRCIVGSVVTCLAGPGRYISSEYDYVTRLRCVSGAKDDTGSVLRCYAREAASGGIQDVVFSEGGEMLLTSNKGGSVQLWDDRFVMKWCHTTPSLALSLYGNSANGICVAGYKDGYVEFRCATDGAVKKRWKVSDREVLSVVPRPGGEEWLIATEDGLLRELSSEGHVIRETQLARGRMFIEGAGDRRLVCTDMLDRVIRLLCYEDGKYTEFKRYEIKSLDEIEARNLGRNLAIQARQGSARVIRQVDMRLVWVEGVREIAWIPNTGAFAESVYAKHPLRDVWAVPGFSTGLRVFELETVEPGTPAGK